MIDIRIFNAALRSVGVLIDPDIAKLILAVHKTLVDNPDVTIRQLAALEVEHEKKAPTRKSLQERIEEKIKEERENANHGN